MKEIILGDLLVLIDRAIASTAFVAPSKWGSNYTHKQVMGSVNRIIKIIGNVKFLVEESEDINTK